VEVWTTSNSEHHHLTDPWPRRTPIHGAAKDGVPIMVKLGGRQFRVLKVVTTYQVNKLGAGRVGTAWKLQLADYRRIVVLHSNKRGWLRAR
jgi:hypothetical protein